jgi:FkbM family methyltransferase
MHPFTAVKKVLTRFGIHACRAGNLPRNLDPFMDIKRLQFSPEVIFDVGANTGQFALAALSAFPGAMVYSFEPIGATYSHLQQAAQGHPRLRPHHLAFGDAPGSATVHLRSNSVWNSLLPFNNNPHNSSGGSETVSVSTVDAFCSANDISKIDLLKTDTEGYDTKVLSGADRMFREMRVRAVYSEVTFLESDQTHTQFVEVFQFLRRHKFILYGVYGFSGDFETMHANALFIRKDP